MDYVPYPYNKEMVAGFFEDYNRSVGLNCGVDGPPKLSPEPQQWNISYEEMTATTDADDVGTDEGTRGWFEGAMNENHIQYWSENGTKANAMFKNNAQLPNFRQFDLGMS